MAAASDTLRYLNIMIDGNIPIVVQLQDDATKVVKPKHKEKGSKKPFHIVGGAFAVPENADKFCKKLISLGYDAQIIDSKNKSVRFVSYGGFSTREEALQAIDKIRAVQGDVWLMTN
jgi:cell division protein FtsN